MNPANHIGIIKKLFDSDALLLSIGDVANAINVSTRQLRYWEKKGYINSKISDSGQRKYTYFTLLRAGNIANFIDQGFTLSVAAEKTENNGMIMKRLREFLQERFNEGHDIKDGYEIDLGEVKGLSPDQHLYIDIMKNGENYFQIKHVDIND